MGAWFFLVNIDKKEKVFFNNIITGVKWRELSGISIAGSMVTYYLLHNSGDRISFINDSDGIFNLFNKQYTWQDFSDYKEMTDKIVQGLIENGIYRDDGIIVIDEDDNLFERNLTNIWDPKFPWNT